MLEIIKDYIKNLPQITFNELFVKYMVDVQDSNIDFEFRRLSSVNLLDVKSMEKLLNVTMKELI